MSPFDPTAIVELRRQLGMNQQTFAHQFRVGQSTVSRWEKGSIRAMAARGGTLQGIAGISAL